MNRLLLVVGSGRCGLLSLGYVLNRQPGAKISFEEPPLLPWKVADRRRVLRERFTRWRRTRGSGFLGDVASFLSPLSGRRPRRRSRSPRRRPEAAARGDMPSPASSASWTSTGRLPHQPLGRRTGRRLASRPALDRALFPQYDAADREDGIRLYWDEYYGRLEELAEKHLHRIRIFDMAEALNTEAGQRAVLDFAGFPAGEQGRLSAPASAGPSRPLFVPRRGQPPNTHSTPVSA